MQLTINIRNVAFQPAFEGEGKIVAPFPSPPPTAENTLWSENLSPYDRLFYHQTLSSARKSRRFVQSPKIPRDALDLRLQSRYDQARETFPDRVDTVMQRETCAHRDAQPTFRLLKNTQRIVIVKEEKLEHVLKIGGVKEKISPHSVKLITSGIHTQLVNNGYSRQQSDGNFFRY